MKETLVFAPCTVVHRFRRTVAFREIEVDKKIFLRLGFTLDTDSLNCNWTKYKMI